MQLSGDVPLLDRNPFSCLPAFLKKKKSDNSCKTAIHMDCDFHFQIRLLLLKRKESNSISNYTTTCIRVWLVTHPCKPAGLCQMKQF